MKKPHTPDEQHPSTPVSLLEENLQFAGTGGVSANNHSLGFIPAFRDIESGKVYLSRFPDGRPAPIHILSGLPNKLKNSVVSGFVREDIFYSREEATQATTSKLIH